MPDNGPVGVLAAAGNSAAPRYCGRPSFTVRFPDSLRVDADANVYAAMYVQGRILNSVRRGVPFGFSPRYSLSVDILLLVGSEVGGAAPWWRD